MVDVEAQMLQTQLKEEFIPSTGLSRITRYDIAVWVPGSGLSPKCPEVISFTLNLHVYLWMHTISYAAITQRNI